MPRRDDFRERSHPRVEAPVITVDLDRGIIRRWRKRNTERRVARLLRPRNRRALADRLRRTAGDPPKGGLPQRGRDLSVRERSAAVRTELLEIADLLEHAHDPDPASVEEIGQLLASGASPLQDPDGHISELYAALYYVRAGLIAEPSSRRSVEIRQPTTRAERKRTRLVSARNRRVLVRQLRLTARRATDRDAIRRRHDVLLHYRAAAVRTDLLEIAALLENTPDPCPDCVAALRTMLANGCDSPLYNADVHFSELQATLDYVRSGL